MKNELRLVCAAVSVRLFVRNFETCHRCAWYLLSDSSELKALSFWHLSILEEDLDSMALQNSSLNAQCIGILKLTKSNSNSLYLLGFMLSASLSGDCLCPVCPSKKMQKETALKGSSHQGGFLPTRRWTVLTPIVWDEAIVASTFASLATLCSQGSQWTYPPATLVQFDMTVAIGKITQDYSNPFSHLASGPGGWFMAHRVHMSLW